MKPLTVSENVTVVLDGEKYLLEAGDRVMVISEGLLNKFAALLIRHKDAIKEALAKAIEEKFGTTDPGELLKVLASKFSPDELKTAAKKLDSLLSPQPAVAVEEVLQESVEAAAAELVKALFTIVAGGGVLSVLAYLYLVHDWSPIRVIERVIDMLVNKR